jgi:nucleoside-diphosphate-sugar epimerase
MASTKPILVTGATGSVGSALVQRLAASGTPVRALVRDPGRAQKLLSLGNVELVVGDLTRPESLRGCAEGCSKVFHSAALLTSLDWKANSAANVGGSGAILEEAIAAKVERFIHLSTIGVYGFTKADDVTEEFPLPPCDYPYFSTKQEADCLVWAARERIPVVIARVGDVVGPGVATWSIGFIKQIGQGLMFPPVRHDSGYINPVYIDNLVDALLLLGGHPAAPGQVFNVVDGTPLPMDDFIRRMAQMAGKRLPSLPGWLIKGAAAVVMTSQRLGGREPTVSPKAANMLLNKITISGEKLRKVTGWKPAVGLDEGFQRTEAWLHQAGYLQS